MKKDNPGYDNNPEDTLPPKKMTFGTINQRWKKW